MTSSIKNYATLESEQFAKSVLNDSVRSTMKNALAGKELYKVTKSSKDEIETIDFNTVIVNELLSQITEETTTKLLALENGDVNTIQVNHSFQGAHFKQYKNGVVCEIPIGLLTNHFFFSNIGPVIPIKFSFVGMMDANVKSKVTSYGINNALVELYILVELTEKITMPLASEKVKIHLEVPFVSQIISGKIPTYYQGGLDSSSNIFSIPLNESENNSDL